MYENNIYCLFSRLSEGQKEYIDKRGVHVVVGHYVGNSMDSLQIPNITRGIRRPQAI